MAIFLDTAALDDIERFEAAGVIRGVTTNPTLLLRETGVRSWTQLCQHAQRIAKAVAPWPVSVPVLADDPEAMVAEGRQLAELADNLVIKVPIHGARGGLGGLTAVRALARAGVSVNVTALHAAQQAIPAALAGAAFVSLLAGRVLDAGGDGNAELSRLRECLDRTALPARIIAASSRHSSNVLDWLTAGAHVVTVRPALLESIVHHAGSAALAASFTADAQEVLR